MRHTIDARIPARLREAYPIAHQPSQSLPVLHVREELPDILIRKAFALDLMTVGDAATDINGDANYESNDKVPAEARG